MARNLKEFVKAEFNKTVTPERKKELSECLKELASTYEGRREIAEIIVDDVTDKYARVDVVEQLGEVRNFEVGEDPNFQVRKGLRGTIHAHGSVAERTEWKTQIYRPTLNLLSVNPECLLFDLQAGRIGSLSDLQADSLDEAQRQIGKNIWDLLKAAITSGDNYFTCSAVNWAAAGATAKTAIKAATRYVADKGGGVKAVVGRLPAIFPIMDLDGFAEDTKRELDLYGRLGTFLGSPLVYIEDYFEGRLGYEYTSMIDSNNLFVVPKTMGIITCYVGGFGAQENLDADTLIFNLHLYRQFGAAVVHNARLARLNVAA